MPQEQHNVDDQNFLPRDVFGIQVKFCQKTQVAFSDDTVRKQAAAVMFDCSFNLPIERIFWYLLLWRSVI
jgi:hypothetical protein